MHSTTHLYTRARRLSRGSDGALSTVAIRDINASNSRNRSVRAHITVSGPGFVLVRSRLAGRALYAGRAFVARHAQARLQTVLLLDGQRVQGALPALLTSSLILVLTVRARLARRPAQRPEGALVAPAV